MGSTTWCSPLPLLALLAALSRSGAVGGLPQLAPRTAVTPDTDGLQQRQRLAGAAPARRRLRAGLKCGFGKYSEEDGLTETHKCKPCAWDRTTIGESQVKASPRVLVSSLCLPRDISRCNQTCMSSGSARRCVGMGANKTSWPAKDPQCRICPKGQTLKGGACASCPLNTYNKLERNGAACLPCPGSATTDGEGTAALSGCLQPIAGKITFFTFCLLAYGVFVYEYCVVVPRMNRKKEVAKRQNAVGGGEL